jgi:predicted aspartyl protease
VPVCAVTLRVGVREAATAAVVREGAEPLLGVETLETLGLRVNPSKGRLEPTRRAAALLVSVRGRYA